LGFCGMVIAEFLDNEDQGEHRKKECSQLGHFYGVVSKEDLLKTWERENSCGFPKGSDSEVNWIGWCKIALNLYGRKGRVVIVFAWLMGTILI
jgi:hypothetical protein